MTIFEKLIPLDFRVSNNDVGAVGFFDVPTTGRYVCMHVCVCIL